MFFRADPVISSVQCRNIYSGRTRAIIQAMPRNAIHIIPVEGVPDVKQGDDLSDLIVQAMQREAIGAETGDVFVVAQKIVSKAEGQVVRLESVSSSKLALKWASDYDKDPRMVEVVLSETRRIVRMDHGVLISETYHGFVCANAGVDASNVEPGTVTLLPVDSDLSARRIKQGLEERLGVEVGVIVSDTFGRPWRDGLVNVALGVAGVPAIEDLRGNADWKGQPLHVTVIAVADELASAAELVMGKDAGIPVAIVRGLKYANSNQSGRNLIRPAELDMFR